MAESMPPAAPDGQTTPVVTRRDFVRRSRVHLSCGRCGTTTITCDIADADLYEAGLAEHVCGQPADLTERAALRRMLRHMVGGA